LLPLYPGFIAYLAGTRPGRPGKRAAALLGLAVLLGLLTTMVLLGLVVSLLAVPLGDVLRWSIPIATVVLVGLGLVLLAGRNPFNRLVGVQVPVVRNPLGQAYVYGLLVGPVALPCAGPFLVALLAISVGIGDAATRIGSFVVYGLGFGLPLVALGAVGATRGQAISRTIARHHLAFLRVAGVLLIVTAVYELLAAGLV
jgi:cytochrome c-type biogenesis protein